MVERSSAPATLECMAPRQVQDLALPSAEMQMVFEEHWPHKLVVRSSAPATSECMALRREQNLALPSPEMQMAIEEHWPH